MRIGLLAGRTLSEHNLRVLQPILADRDFEVALVVVDGRPPKSTGQKVIDHLRRGRGGYVLVMAVQKCFLKPAYGMTVEEFCRANGIVCLEIASPYSAQASAQIREHNLDLLVLVNGFGIIRGTLLNVCPKGILSYHHGDMRKYRGMPPGLWELYNGETEIGITVQQIAGGLDHGIPIEEKQIPIYPNDTLGTLMARVKREDEGMLYAALKKMADPDFTPVPIQEFGKVYTLPNLRQWIVLNARITCRRLLCRLFPHLAENP
jgi:folate-dependent phosphoribosylglycinamide formyltransferase PurN